MRAARRKLRPGRQAVPGPVTPAAAPSGPAPGAAPSGPAPGAGPGFADRADLSRLRLDRLDALRGAAMVWMATFHFCYDLDHLGLWQPRQAFLADPFWTVQRAAIVTLFLACAGLSQAAAQQQAQPATRFWRRWAQVAAGAALVSAGSAWMFPRTWIWFGVLHAVAVMLLVLRLLPPRPAPRAALALVALALPLFVSLRGFDAPLLQWLGLGTRAPVTEDWVPLLPWLGVVLAGWVAGWLLLSRRPAWVRGGLPGPLRPLARLGRWPLSFYLLHQPVLIGLLSGGRAAGWW